MAVVDGYGELAEAALARLAIVDDGAQPAFVYAYAACALAQLRGWSDGPAQAYLAQAWALRLASADGSLRGWSSTAAGQDAYTISLVDHAGPAFVAAYASGQTAVTAQQVLDIARVLMTTPRTTPVVGWSVSYLSQAPSTVNVYNVSAAAALLLEQIRVTGLVVPPANGASAETLTMQLARSVSAAYQASAGHNWPYSSTGGTNDCDHLSLLCEACQTLGPPLGRHAGLHLMQTAYTGPSEVNAALGHLRLGGTALGRPYAGAWLAEAQAYFATQQNNPTRLAQIARWAARIAVST